MLAGLSLVRTGLLHAIKVGGRGCDPGSYSGS